MPLQHYYANAYGIQQPIGSRSASMLYGGAVCPQQASFGRVHGTSPARGTLQFKGVVYMPIAQPVMIQIGQSVYYGFAVKAEISYSAQTGNNTTFSLVDLRDRLHDVNHFAQYNMVDDKGTWWHILPDLWAEQGKTHVRQMQSIADFSEDQEIVDYNINLLENCPPMLASITLLKYFAVTYGFSFTWTQSAGNKLFSHYPENLDFNAGVKVIDCIQQILERSNLQFTAWGNLHLHMSDRGYADNAFEAALLSGNVDLCSFQGYVDAALGAELNEKGRRAVLVGGRNQYEHWYPCYPDWNKRFTFELCNDVGYEFSALLAAHQLTRLNKLKDLPDEYHDPRKHNGKKRIEMSIKDYLDQVCFKSYVIDFGTVLREDRDDPDGRVFYVEKEDNTEDVTDIDIDPNTGERTVTYNDNAFELYEYEYDEDKPYAATGSFYPISKNLPTDSNRQFLVKGSVRNINQKGDFDIDFFASGKFSYILEGVSIEIEEKISNGPTDEKEEAEDLSSYCRNYYSANLIFNERKFKGEASEVVLPSGQTVPEFTFEPDEIYVKISIDKEMYRYVLGESELTPRVRETIISESDIFKSYIDYIERQMIVQNFVDQNFVNSVYTDEIANEIVTRKLIHEYITTAGYITFRSVAGYMPSGVIESVNCTFDPSRGTREVINFTTEINDNRIPNRFPQFTRQVVKGAEEIAREQAIKDAQEIQREMNKVTVVNATQRHHDDFNPLNRALAFGVEKNAANVNVSKDLPPNNGIQIGDILIVDQADQVA